MGLTKSIGASLQRFTSQRRTPALRINSEQYDDVEAARAVRRLTKNMRAIAAQRDALATMRWSYIVATTLEEMEREAAAEQRLMELRIAMLQVQPACRHFLADIRHVVLEARGDEALSLLKYAVAWRKVFGPDKPNTLQAVLDLATMGAALRSHTTSGKETLYVATSQEMDAYQWNKRETALEPSQIYLGSGFSTGRQPRLTVDDLVVAIDDRGAAAEPVVTADVELQGLAAPPTELAAPPEPESPPLPETQQPRSHPHVSSPHHFHTDPAPRLAQLAHPGVQVPPAATRPLLRRMAARVDGLGDPSVGGVVRPVNFPGSAPPPTVAPPPFVAEELPPVRDQVRDAVRGALTDMNRLAGPRGLRPPQAPPSLPPAQRPEINDSGNLPHHPSRGHRPPRRPGPRAPHRGI